MKMAENNSEPALRVLMVSQRMLPYVAGAELKALGLARALLSLGADARIITTRFASGLKSTETMRGVRVRRLPVLRESRATNMSQFFAMAAYVAARGRSFDIAHAHCLSASSLGAIMGAKLIGLPIIVEPSLGGADGELRKLIESPYALMLLSVLSEADHFAVNDSAVADEMAAQAIRRDRITLVNNGVDLDEFYPASFEQKREARLRLSLQEGPVALFAGQLIERKGVGQLLAAWRELVAEMPEATLVFAGDGAQAEAVRREAARHGSRILYIGVRDDMANVMRAADTLALPSRNESFGNVVIEAMASGLAVVVGPTGIALREPIEGGAGRVVDPDSAADICSALRDILGSPDRGAARGRNARRIAEHYDFRKVAGEYLALYKSVIKDKRI
jgi:glycosyltransferase involved in cell wall biosynthesis